MEEDRKDFVADGGGKMKYILLDMDGVLNTSFCEDEDKIEPFCTAVSGIGNLEFGWCNKDLIAKFRKVAARKDVSIILVSSWAVGHRHPDSYPAFDNDFREYLRAYNPLIYPKQGSSGYARASRAFEYFEENNIANTTAIYLDDFSLSDSEYLEICSKYKELGIKFIKPPILPLIGITDEDFEMIENIFN